MRVAVVLFTRDLRVHDHPALRAAAEEAEAVVPLFVLDDGILASDFASPNRVAFLRESLVDLDRSLRRSGARLHLRRGAVVESAVAIAREAAATAIYCSADVSAYAQGRERRLARACASDRLELRVVGGTTVVEPDEVRTTEGNHFSVFTPYWRRWREAPLRAVARAPKRLRTPPGIDPGRLPALGELIGGQPASDLPAGGESAGRA